MDLSDLRIFQAVAQAGGITRAAERLHRVQSNVTTRIKQLENDLGVVLFIREGKRLQISPAGQILLEHTEEILASVERAREAVHETKPRGVLRLGAMESTAAVRLPAPLSAYHDLYPEVSIELSTGAPRDQIVQVLKGELDAALVVEPVIDPRLEMHAVFEERFVLIASAKHPPISSPRSIQSQTILAFHPGCPHRNRLEGWFAREGVPIRKVVEMTSYNAMLGCTVAGMGIALIPRSVLEAYAERSRLSVHPIQQPEFARAKTLLIWRRETPQVKVMRLADILLAEAKEVSSA